MQKLSHTAPYIAYAVATAGMAVLLLLGSSPGAIVARSYRAYNGRAVPGYTEYTYRDVNLSFSVPLSPVTAVEARAKTSLRTKKKITGACAALWMCRMRA